MARINRSDVIQKAVNDLGISTSTEKVPNETLDKVQLTYDLNRNVSTFVTSANRAVTGSVTINLPVVDSRSEIYLTSLHFDLVKDATCDVATGSTGITGTPDFSSVSTTILRTSLLTLTAQQSSAHTDFAYPLKMKPGVNLSGGITYSLGLCSLSITATGFIVSSN